MKKKIFKNITIFFGDTIFLSSPIDDSRGNPTKDSIVKWFQVPEVFSFLIVESGKDSSEVEVFVLLVTINSVQVNVLR